MVEFFQMDKAMDLERITTATLSKLEEIKERTATGILEAFTVCSQTGRFWKP